MGERKRPETDFWRLLMDWKGLGPSTVNSYKSVFRLTTKNGTWALRQLQAQWPEADWSAISDLTQLPEEDRSDMLDYLLRACAEEGRGSPLASHLKKLRSAIELYQELVLGRTAAPPPRTQAALRQEGPLCFSALLELWSTAAAPDRPTDQAKDWLRFLLRLVEQLLGVLKSRTAPLLRSRTAEPLQHRRKTLPQGHRLGDDAVILVLQHRVHRLGHDILQCHPIRRGGFIFRSRDPLLFLDRFRLRNRLRFRNGLRLGRRPLRRLLQDRLTPTLAVLGKDGLQ